MDNKAQGIITHLKASKKKITLQREKIIEYLFKSTNMESNLKTNHPTAEEIFSNLKNIEQRITISTVYNTLELLREEKLIDEFVTQVNCNRGKGSAIRIETNLKPHLNLICNSCSRIEDLFLDETDQLRKLIMQRCDFKVDKYQFYGLCSECSKD